MGNARLEILDILSKKFSTLLNFSQDLLIFPKQQSLIISTKSFLQANGKILEFLFEY